MTAPEYVLIITTVFTGIVSVIGAIKGSSNSKKIDDAKVQFDKQDVKLDVIHEATNSNLKKALDRVMELETENQKLKEDLLRFNKRHRIP